MKRIIWFWMFVSVFLSSVIFFRGQSWLTVKPERPIRIKSSATERGKIPTTSKVAQNAKKANLENDIEIQYNENGVLTTGRFVKPNKKEVKGGVDLLSDQKVEEKAVSILQRFERALGGVELKDLKIQSITPLDGGAGYNVVFKQLVNGFQVAPYGSLHLRLSSGGDLLEITNRTINQLKLSGNFSIDMTEARKAIRTEVRSRTYHDERLEGGRKVAWVVGYPLSENPEARLAYEFFMSGRQLILDGQTGSLIETRDRRTF